MVRIELDVRNDQFESFVQFLKTLDYVRIVHTNQPETGDKESNSPFYWLELLALAGGVQSIEKVSEWQRLSRGDRERIA